MAMTIRLSNEEIEALRRKAQAEGRSVHEVARTAINRYTSDRDTEFGSLVESIVVRDQELLDRLAQ